MKYIGKELNIIENKTGKVILVCPIKVCNLKQKDLLEDEDLLDGTSEHISDELVCAVNDCLVSIDFHGKYSIKTIKTSLV